MVSGYDLQMAPNLARTNHEWMNGSLLYGIRLAQRGEIIFKGAILVCFTQRASRKETREIVY